MSGIGENSPAFAFSGAQATPNEVDRYDSYSIVHPSISATTLGTVTSATANPAFVFDNIRPDYPRNVLFSILGVSGGMGGTARVVGTDIYGVRQVETLAVGSANGGGSVAGTVCYAVISAATLTGIDGLGGTAIGTARLGYAIGTAAGLVARFALPTKIGAVSDVKRITYTSQGVGGTALNGGTIGTANVDATNHHFLPGRIMAGTEIYQITIKSTYSNLGKPNLTGL